MQIPAATIATFLAAGIAQGAIAATAVNASGSDAERAKKLALTVGGLTSIALLVAGYALNGVKRPNTVGRGLLWAGGVSGAFTAANGLGLLSAKV